MEYEYRWRNWLDLEWSLWYILGIIFSFIDCVLIYRCINFIKIYKSFDIIWNINNYKNIKIDYETKFWINDERYLHQICVIFISGIHGVWCMGQFGSSIGFWNQYSKIFGNNNFWIFFGINIPNSNLVNLGPFKKVLPIPDLNDIKSHKDVYFIIAIPNLITSLSTVEIELRII